MIRVVALKRNLRGGAQLIEKYYNIADPERLEEIRFDIFNPQKNLTQRKEAFEKHKKTILRLKSIFKQLVFESNRSFQNRGYKNYFDFATKYDGIPEAKLELFFNKADEIIEKITKVLPLPRKNSSWYWTEYNIPDFLALVTNQRYSVPESIYKKIKKSYPKIAKIIPRIKIRELKEEFYPVTKYDKDRKAVTIFMSTKRTDIYNVLTFLHELGHAVTFLSLVDKGINPLSKSRYWHEKKAYQQAFEFEEAFLSKKIRDASMGRILGDYSSAFFEHAIYTNPNQDFDRVFAETINRCYLLSNQTKNPFYVLENHFIARPCYTVISAVAETEVLLDRLNNKER